MYIPFAASRVDRGVYIVSFGWKNPGGLSFGIFCSLHEISLYILQLLRAVVTGSVDLVLVLLSPGQNIIIFSNYHKIL